MGEHSVVESDVSYTVSTFKVEKTVSPASLGSGLRDGASSIASGQTIEVRQIGSSGMDTTPAPLLEVG